MVDEAVAPPVVRGANLLPPEQGFCGCSTPLTSRHEARLEGAIVRALRSQHPPPRLARPRAATRRAARENDPPDGGSLIPSNNRHQIGRCAAVCRGGRVRVERRRWTRPAAEAWLPLGSRLDSKPDEPLAQPPCAGGFGRVARGCEESHPSPVAAVSLLPLQRSTMVIMTSYVQIGWLLARPSVDSE